MPVLPIAPLNKGLSTTLDYPGVMSTSIMGINDIGTIIATITLSDESSYPVDVAILGIRGFSPYETVDLNSLSFGRTGDEVSLAYCSDQYQDVDNEQKVNAAREVAGQTQQVMEVHRRRKGLDPNLADRLTKRYMLP